MSRRLTLWSVPLLALSVAACGTAHVSSGQTSLTTTSQGASGSAISPSACSLVTYFGPTYNSVPSPFCQTTLPLDATIPADVVSSANTLCASSCPNGSMSGAAYIAFSAMDKDFAAVLLIGPSDGAAASCSTKSPMGTTCIGQSGAPGQTCALVSSALQWLHGGRCFPAATGVAEATAGKWSVVEIGNLGFGNGAGTCPSQLPADVASLAACSSLG